MSGHGASLLTFEAADDAGARTYGRGVASESGHGPGTNGRPHGYIVARLDGDHWRVIEAWTRVRASGTESTRTLKVDGMDADNPQHDAGEIVGAPAHHGAGLLGAGTL